MELLNPAAGISWAGSFSGGTFDFADIDHLSGATVGISLIGSRANPSDRSGSSYRE